MVDSLYATARIFTGTMEARGYIRDRSTGKVVWACDHMHKHRLFQKKQRADGPLYKSAESYAMRCAEKKLKEMRYVGGTAK